VRIHGDMKKLEQPPLSAEEVHEMVFDIMADALRKTFQETHEADFSFELGNIARFRVNVFRQRKGESAVFRLIPSKVMTIEELGLPGITKEVCDKEKGLVLVTGPTGSGKSTSLAAMVDYINERFEGTFSPSRTLSSSCTSRRNAWSTNVNSAPTPWPSPTPYALRCVRIRM